MAEQQPRLILLYQAIITPQRVCEELHSEVSGILLSPYEGDWRIEIHQHRLAITFRIMDQVPDEAVKPTVETLRNTGRHISHLVLRSQALFSRQLLEASFYTVTMQLGNRPMESLFVDLGEQQSKEPQTIRSEDFKRGVNVIARPSAFGGHDNLQRALRDFEMAIKVTDTNRLIYLWRAVEEILWYHYFEDNPSSNEFPRNPPYSNAANCLHLYSNTNEREGWLSELGRLAHQYARHAEARPHKTSLPADLNECIEAAEKRVVEIIERHARHLSEEEIVEPPPSDILTGWLNDIVMG
jgi:hypothetical protein